MSSGGLNFTFCSVVKINVVSDTYNRLGIDTSRTPFIITLLLVYTTNRYTCACLLHSWPSSLYGNKSFHYKPLILDPTGGEFGVHVDGGVAMPRNEVY